jgi:hypothetical protein
MPVDYEKIGKLRRNLGKIIEEFVSFENQLYPVQEFYKNLGKVLDKTLEDLTEVDKNLVHIINKDR